MKKFAQRMDALSNGMDDKARELAGLVQDNLLTMDEAVTCHMGAELKLREELGNSGKPDASFSRLLIQQAIDGTL